MSFLDCQIKVTENLAVNFTQFIPEAVLVPVTEFKDVKDVRVFTIPFESVITLFSRSKTEKIYTIQIGVIQKVNSANPATDVLDLVEEIVENFHDKNLPEGIDPPLYIAAGLKNIPFYDYENLDEDRVIVSVVQVDYKEYVS